jgi:hypothetical protein
MSDDALFFAVRRRGYELAETGRFKHRLKVADALLAEGFVGSVIKTLDRDALGVMMITRCCDQTRAGEIQSDIQSNI